MSEPLARPLVNGEDYYIEAGRYVFTAAYHRRRGVCCGNACRHCPFNFVNVPPGRRPDRSVGSSTDNFSVDDSGNES